MTKGASNVYAWLSAGDYIHATDQKGEMIMSRWRRDENLALSRIPRIKYNPIPVEDVELARLSLRKGYTYAQTVALIEAQAGISTEQEAREVVDKAQEND
jgi:hypothetical protein